MKAPRTSQGGRRSCNLAGQDRFAGGSAAAFRGPQEAVIRQPFEGLHGGFVAAGVLLGVHLQAAQLEVGVQLAADIGERHGHESQALFYVAVQRPWAGPEHRAFTVAKRFVAVGDIAGRDFMLIEQVEHPLHGLHAGFRVDSGLSSDRRWRGGSPSGAATMPQVTVGCTPEPVIMMPERTTLSPSYLVMALAQS